MQKALIVALSLATLVGALVFLLERRTPAPSFSARPLGGIPDGVTAILHVDLNAIKRSWLGERWLRLTGGLSEACGTDPLLDVQTLSAFLMGSDPRTLDHIGLLAHGDGNRETLERCLEAVITKEGGVPRRVEIDGVMAMAGRGQGRVALLAGGVVAGDEATVTAVLRTLRGLQPSAESHPTLKGLFDRMEARDGILVGLIPASLKAALRAQLREEGRESLAPLLGVQSVALGVDLSDRLDFEVVLGFREASVSQHGARVLGAWLTQQRSRATDTGSPWAPLLPETQVRSVGNAMSLSGHLTRTQVDTLLALLERALTPEPPEP